MTQRASTSLLLGACLLAAPVSAQRGPVALRGVVYDSLRGHPVRDAFVTIAGSDRPITTDSRGRFRFDSVEPGVHVVTAQHALFDSIGFSGLTTRATIVDGGREIELATPSFETLWRLSCRNKPPDDSGMVYGTVRDAATGRPVLNAAVELTWWDLRLDRNHRLKQRTWRIETQTNTNGDYAMCGVAAGSDFQVHAALGAKESGFIEMPPSDVRVQRRDLLVGASDIRQSSRGTIIGIVTDPDGQGVEGARVILDQESDVRTRADGQFTIAAAPAGTRKLEVRSLGAVPSLASADVTPGDTVLVSFSLEYGKMLRGMRTTAASAKRVFAADFNDRRKRGFGYARDSTELSKYNQFIDALRDVPSMRVEFTGTSAAFSVPDGVGGFCAPDVFIDGARAEFGHLIDLMPVEVGALEVYQRAAHIPARFVPPGFQPQCGMILVWTKYGLSNR